MAAMAAATAAVITAALTAVAVRSAAITAAAVPQGAVHALPSATSAADSPLPKQPPAAARLLAASLMLRAAPAIACSLPQAVVFCPFVVV